MNIIVITGSVFLYILFYFLFYKKIFLLELLYLLVYLFGVMLIRSLDVLLPIYFIVTVLPFLAQLRYIKKTTFYIFLIYIAYIIYGLLLQSPVATIHMFVSRCWNILAFFLIFESVKDIQTNVSDSLIRIGAVTELVFATYLFLTKGGGGAYVRLVAGAQPVCGNVSISILPVLGYKYFTNKENGIQQTVLLWWIIYFGIWPLLSGTRGYTLQYFIVTGWVFVDFFFSSNGKKVVSIRNRFVLLAVFFGLIAAAVFLTPTVTEKIYSISRLGKQSTGIRRFENSAAIDFFRNTVLHIQIFGVGMGGKLGSHAEFLQAIYKQHAIGMWNIKHYLMDSGALFHNVYMNILCNMGLLGITLFSYNVFRILKYIRNIKISKSYRIFTIVYLAGFLLMIWYRWSTDCGIASMIFLALSIRLYLQKHEAMDIGLNYNSLAR